MRFNAITLSLYLFIGTDIACARPTPDNVVQQRGDMVGESTLVQLHRRGGAAAPAQQVSCTSPPAAQEQQPGAGEGAGGQEAAAENEVEIQSLFNTATAVQGGDLKQDLVFTPSTVGKFEYEFQSATADEVTVTENTSPAAPPTGFEAIEPNSYVVALSQSKGAGLTLSKIDYIFDVASAGLAGKDITKAQVGRLCSETNAFVISQTLGELEFELEENEVTLNLNKNVTAQGEWGIFLPVAAAAAADAEAIPKAKPAPKAEGASKPKHSAEDVGEGIGEGASQVEGVATGHNRQSKSE
ncbi:hypothetical protein ACN47E_008912 [Coniothyrium glycines]